jgi:class 3 adenylate cyclase
VPNPASYTPRHVSEQILAVRGAIEGERKQVSVLFCDIVASSVLNRSRHWVDSQLHAWDAGQAAEAEGIRHEGVGNDD